MSSKGPVAAREVEQKNMLTSVSSILEADRRVVAAWLFGSIGNGTGDSFSDVDLWIVISDAHIDSIISTRREFVAKLASPLLMLEAPQNAPAGGAYLLALYSGEAGPHHVDWYWQPQSRAAIPADVRLLFDHVGLPRTPHPATTPQPSDEERAANVTNQVAFFWVMCIVAAKKIARRQSWSAVAMLGLLNHTLEEVAWLIGVRAERPDYKETRTNAPPVRLSEQMVMLREMAKMMEKLAPDVAAVGGIVPMEAIRQVYTFFDLIAE